MIQVSCQCFLTTACPQLPSPTSLSCFVLCIGSLVPSKETRDNRNYCCKQLLLNQGHRSKGELWVCPCFTHIPVKGEAWWVAGVKLVCIHTYWTVQRCNFWQFLFTRSVMISPLPPPNLFSKNEAFLRVLGGQRVSERYADGGSPHYPFVANSQEGLKLSAL